MGVRYVRPVSTGVRRGSAIGGRTDSGAVRCGDVGGCANSPGNSVVGESGTEWEGMRRGMVEMGGAGGGRLVGWLGEERRRLREARSLEGTTLLRMVAAREEVLCGD